MDVRALGMNEVAKLAKAAKVEGEHLNFTVAAVFELHAVALEALGSLDELPAFIDGEGRGNFGRDMLAGVHRVEGDRHVEFPRRRVVDEIDVLVVAELLPFLGTAGVDFWGGTASPCRRVERALDARSVKVADRGEFAAGDCVEAVNAGTAAAEADYADTELLVTIQGPV